MAELKHEIKPEGIAEAVSSEQYRPSVYLEISKEQLEILEVGNTVDIRLLGKVKSLTARDEEAGQYEISLELQEVAIDPKGNEFTRMAEEDD